MACKYQGEDSFLVILSNTPVWHSLMQNHFKMGQLISFKLRKIFKNTCIWSLIVLNALWNVGTTCLVKSDASIFFQEVALQMSEHGHLSSAGHTCTPQYNLTQGYDVYTRVLVLLFVTFFAGPFLLTSNLKQILHNLCYHVPDDEM